ncbi:MAG: hypothetical protein J6M39_05060 [Lachnospiraceae bacterium]|nr:hypothetical protein [Lachnospiraceae bacterium]
MGNANTESLLNQALELIQTKQFKKSLELCEQITNENPDNGDGWYYYFLALNSKQSISECNISDCLVCDDYLEKAIQYTNGDINTELQEYSKKMQSAYQMLNNSNSFLNANEKIDKYLQYADNEIQEKVKIGFRIINDAKKINDTDIIQLSKYNTTCAKVKLLIDDLFDSGIMSKVDGFINEKEATQPSIDKCNERIENAQEAYDDRKIIEDDLQKDLNGIYAEINSYDVDIKGYDNSISSLKGKIAFENGKKLLAKDQVAKNAIKRNISEYEREIKQCQSEINKIITIINRLDGKAATVQTKLESAKENTSIAYTKLNDEKQKLQDIYDDLESKKQIILGDLNVRFDDCYDISYNQINNICDNNIRIGNKEDLFNYFNANKLFNGIYNSYVFDSNLVKGIYQYVRNVNATEYQSQVQGLLNSLDDFLNNIGDYKNQDDYLMAKSLLFVNNTEEESIVIEKLKDAKQRFEALEGYKDSNELELLSNYQLGKCLAFMNPERAIELLQTNVSYKDSSMIIDKCNIYIEQAKNDKKRKMMFFALVGVAIVVVIVIVTVIMNAIR